MADNLEINILNAVSNIGIPSAIAFFVLIKIQASMERLTDAVVKLTAKIDARLSG